MTPFDLQKFLKWYEKYAVSAMSVETFFTAAYIHRYGRPMSGALTERDRAILDLNLAAWKDSHRLPDFARQFWREVVIPTLLREGGNRGKVA